MKIAGPRPQTISALKDDGMHRVCFIVIAVALTFLPAQVNGATAAQGSTEKLSPTECACQLKDAVKKGNWREAADSAEKLLATDPYSAEAGDAYLWLGLYHKFEFDFDKSTHYYQKAVDLYPGTWTSAEAIARLGCNQYKLNNYGKALEYFRMAGVEAKTWQQRKYASAWTKWVKTALASGQKKAAANCATKALDHYLKTQGIKYDKDKLADSLTLQDGLVPLSNILQCLTKQGVKLQAVKCPIERLSEVQLPVVAVVKPSHTVIIKEMGERIAVYDPAVGNIHYYESELARIWTGQIVTISNPVGRASGSDDRANFLGNLLTVIFGQPTPKFASITQTDMSKVLLGACPCCPQTVPSCDADSDCCAVCSIVESGLPGGPGGSSGPNGGGTGGSSGPGCGSCATPFARGFPKLSVNTALLTLIIRDTPIGYSTPIGPDVDVTMTFNTDLATEGVFGHSWRANFETMILETTNTVVVTRANGHDDTFTLSGGEYNPPAGETDRLIKNANGTFTLEFTRSHKKFLYDTNANGGKLLAKEDEHGNSITFQYDTNSQLTSITDAVGRVTTIEMTKVNNQPRVSTVIDPLGRHADFTYYSNGNLETVTDMGGYEFAYTYDPNDDLITVTEPKGTYYIEYAPYSYETSVKSITDPNGNTWHYGGNYNDSYVEDPRSNKTSYTIAWHYPDIVGTAKIIAPISDPISQEPYTIQYTYDESTYERTSVTDRRGYATTYIYTDHDVSSVSDPCYYTWSYTYDTNRRRTSATDPRGKVTTYVYTGNNLTSVTETDPNEIVLSTSSYTYYSNGLRESSTVNGNTTIYNYDTKGNLTQVTEPMGGITTFTYDDVGRKISMTNDIDMTTYYEYDDLDRIKKITHPDQTYAEYTYNCCGVSSYRDENGHYTYYDRDQSGRLAKVTDAEQHETTYHYDAAGNLAALKDQLGKVTAYTYDAMNRLTRVVYPGGDVESYTLDANGNMLTKTDSRGTTHYEYDKNNRVTRIWH
jgi:YD repeat-containing protein